MSGNTGRYFFVRPQLRRRAKRDEHCRNEGNKIDPDDGNSRTCAACNLPIFSTPYVDGDGAGVYLHDRCANLPKELTDCDTHPNKPLILRASSSHEVRKKCDVCKKGLRPPTMLYRCIDSMYCDYKIHVICALPTWIRILHRSHEHRLMVIRSGATASFICSACGSRHDEDDELVYVCSACCFWIHPRCASLPNAVLLRHADHLHQLHHEHPLLLDYGEHSQTTCRICQGIIRSLGMYSCNICRYYVHIMCAVSHPHSVDPVLIRKTRLPDLVHLPIANEHASLIHHITGITSSTCDDDDNDRLKQVENLHQHPLVLHHEDENGDDDDPRPERVCRACFQYISPPFYKCSECPTFFLHKFCAGLPPTLTRHTTHDKDHPFVLSRRAVSVEKSCKSCRNECINGLSYSCEICKYDLHVLCALMPASITHDAHATTHILYSKHIFEPSAPGTRGLTDQNQLKDCDCCAKKLIGTVAYECGTCHGFRIHAVCALLPDTVSHKFDEHPLNLITTKQMPQSSQQSTHLLFCEICENEINCRCVWYYRCTQCDQSFHASCIPYLRSILYKLEPGYFDETLDSILDSVYYHLGSQYINL